MFDDPQSSKFAISCVRRPRVVKDVIEVCSAASCRLNPPHHMFDNMSTSASHLVLKQDVTIFSLGIRTIRPCCWALLCSTTLSLIIPARPMFDDTLSSKPIDDHVRRLGVVEYQVELSRSAAVLFLSPSHLLRVSIPSFMFACCLRFDLSAPP
jgi:hypothetical protein